MPRPDPSYGSYPSLDSSFYNSGAMMPSSNGRLAVQVPTPGDLGPALSTSAIMGMRGGNLRQGMSHVDSEQYAIREHYRTASDRAVDALRATTSLVGYATGAASTYSLAQGVTAFGLRKLGYAGGADFVKNTMSIGNLGRTMGSYGNTLISKGGLARYAGGALRLGSLGVRGLALATASLPVTLAIAAGMYGVNKVLESYDARKEAINGPQDLFDSQGFSGSALSDTSGGISIAARRDVNRVFRNNTVDAYGRNGGFARGELNTVARFAADNNLLEGYTGSTDQLASRVMSLAKVAKDVVKIGATITAADAMELQKLTNSLGINNTELTQGGLGKKLVNAAKASGVSTMQMAEKTMQAGAQYMSMGFSAAQGMKMSAYSTIGARSLVGSGKITGVELAEYGGVSGLENALFRSGTIAMQNNSQTLAMATMKMRNGKMEVDHKLLKDFYTGNLSVEDMQVLAKRNMVELSKSSIDPKERIKMLAQIQRDMPSVIKNISSNMSPEQQMALAGQSILSMADKYGSIGAAMDEYFGEDTQARNAFEKYSRNFKSVKAAERKLDVRNDVERYRSAMSADSAGYVDRAYDATTRAIGRGADFIARYTIDPIVARSIRAEEMALSTAAGYFGGESSGSLLAYLEGTSGASTRTISRANIEANKDILDKVVEKITSKGLQGTMGDFIPGTSKVATESPFEELRKELASANSVRQVGDVARKRGFRIAEGQDTGLFTGDLDSDLVDRLTGKFYSDSLTNSAMNLFGIGGGIYRGGQFKEAFLAATDIGDLYVSGANNNFADEYSKQLSASAGSTEAASQKAYKDSLEFQKLVKEELKKVAGNSSFNVSKNQSFTVMMDAIRTKATKLGLNKQQQAALLRKVVNEGLNSSDTQDGTFRRGAGLYAEMERDIANSFDIQKLVTGVTSTPGDITTAEAELRDVASLEGLDRNSQSKLFNYLSGIDTEERQNSLASALKLDDDALRARLASLAKVDTSKLTTPEQFSKIRKIMEKVASGKVDPKLLQGIKNIENLMNLDLETPLDAKGALDTQIATQDLTQLKTNLASSTDTSIANLGKFLGGGTEADNVVKAILGKNKITLQGIVGSNTKFTESDTAKFNSQLNQINEITDQGAKRTALEKLLKDIAITAGSTGPTSGKDAKNLDQIMNEISVGLTSFNTTMQSIANNITGNKPLEIKLTK
jgi:hypothetical protein